MSDKQQTLESADYFSVPVPDKSFVPPTIETDFPDTKAGQAPASAPAFLTKVQDAFEAANLATHTPAPKSVDGDDTSRWRGGNTGK
jgi:hypothetical protein